MCPNAMAGRKNPLNSTPPEVSNSILCSDQSTDEDLKMKREDFCKLTNSVREWHLTHTLKLDARLNDIAQLEAKLLYDIANKTKDVEAVSGSTSDSTGDSINTGEDVDSDQVDFSTILEKIKQAGIEVGEFGFHVSTAGLIEAHDVIRKSLNSATPRKKFLDKSYRKVGVGFYHGVWISLFTD